MSAVAQGAPLFPCLGWRPWAWSVKHLVEAGHRCHHRATGHQLSVHSKQIRGHLHRLLATRLTWSSWEDRRCSLDPQPHQCTCPVTPVSDEQSEAQVNNSGNMWEMAKLNFCPTSLTASPLLRAAPGSQQSQTGLGSQPSPLFLHSDPHRSSETNEIMLGPMLCQSLA